MKRSRLGKCYQLAGGYALDRLDATLVHGSIQGFDNPRIGHAWVETPEGIWEPITDQYWPEAVFRGFFHAQIDQRYGPEEMRVEALKTGHWGPWAESSGAVA